MSEDQRLTQQQVAAYKRDGYLAPVDVLAAEEASHYLGCFETFAAAWGKPIKRAENLHRVFPWAHQLACRPLHRVAQLLGPGLKATDLLIWGTLVFCKFPKTKGFVAWHQDGAYADFLAGAPSLTAWIALTHSNQSNGCMRFSPGTHVTRFRHDYHDSPDNLNPAANPRSRVNFTRRMPWMWSYGPVRCPCIT